MGSLTIHLEDLKESPRPFRLECDRGWWERTREILREPEVSMARPLIVEVSGHRLGLRLLFRGALSGTLELTCGRCLEPYLHPLREEIQLLLEAFQWRETQFGPEHSHTINMLNQLVNLYEAWNKPEEAKEWRGKLPQMEDSEE